MRVASPKNTKICVFCKHWTASKYKHIIEHSPNTCVWKYDDLAKEKCKLSKLPTGSWTSCGNFECKFK